MSRAWAGFRFMLASRGWRRGLYRAWLIWRRFGLTRRGMERNLRCLRAVLEQHGARATLFVPATVLRDHRASLAAFFTPTFEWGIHSDDHTDLSRLPREEQARRIGRAIRLFEAAGVPFAGFRAPYLKTGAATLPVLAATGRFLYDSSSCLLWDDIPDIADVAPPPAAGSHALEFYRPDLRSRRPCRVEREEGLLRIPVSLPDDDILVDRDRRAPDAVYATWSAILERSHQEGEIFVLQLHPERACELAGVLSRLLQRARELSPPVWIATLGEVAQREGWPPPCRSAFCVTGDLDAMAVSDFLKRLRTW